MFTFLPTKEIILLNMSKNIKQISKTNQEQFFCPENNALKVKRECISELEHKKYCIN